MCSKSSTEGIPDHEDPVITAKASEHPKLTATQKEEPSHERANTHQQNGYSDDDSTSSQGGGHSGSMDDCVDEKLKLLEDTIKEAQELLAAYSRKTRSTTLEKRETDQKKLRSEGNGATDVENDLPAAEAESQKPAETQDRASTIAYKRVDQTWNANELRWQLSKTGKSRSQEKWDKYIFKIRRTFDETHKHTGTFVDIKSSPLKECLQAIMKDVKSVSLVVDTPKLDPNMLFLHLGDCRVYLTELWEDHTAERKQSLDATATKAKHLEVLVSYLDKDYAEIKETLYPMLASNTITFELLWALFKPDTIVCCSTYDDADQLRAFKVERAYLHQSSTKGLVHRIMGCYLEYDGKKFGKGNLSVDVPVFQGVCKISTLACYPLQYHADPAGLRANLLECGKKFVALQGVQHRYHNGMAYAKQIDGTVLKINIDGRIMVDPALHRRNNANHCGEVLGHWNDEDSLDSKGEQYDGSDGRLNGEGEQARDHDSSSSPGASTHESQRYRVDQNCLGEYTVIEVNSCEENNEGGAFQEKLSDAGSACGQSFREEDLLIASPKVLGFALGEKSWLEFTVSGISNMTFDEHAFDALVLPENQKSIVRALVSSHASPRTHCIDDIISGKGKGIVAVLHGPPGTGKTITAEGIAELLKRPLYMVSVGNLGTEPSKLETQLQETMNIAHSWGAILLLDEADVFLEKRSIQDIHRNALVSVFLRLLEYFQGILFLTTNRVETFDEAFVSRIHLSLRYGELTQKAKKSVWKMFITRVKTAESAEMGDFTEEGLTDLSRRDVNGRQIKNIVRAAHALAVHEDKPLAMVHIKRVIDVAEAFGHDIQGGTGYMDAMRSYT